MFKRIIGSVAVLAMTLMASLTAIEQPQPTKTVTVKSQEYTSKSTAQYIEVKTLIKETKGMTVGVSHKDMELIALITMAEAEGESERGKRLVISTILNRLDSEYFPDSVEEVIYQPGQFSSVWNGRVDRCHVQPDIYQLVKEEVISRTDDEVIFFHADRYSNYGVPMFREGGHYFSSYE